MDDNHVAQQRRKTWCCIEGCSASSPRLPRVGHAKPCEGDSTIEIDGKMKSETEGMAR